MFEPISTASQLRRYKVRQAEELLVFGVRQTDETPVAATVFGTQMAPKTLDRLFRPFAQEHGFDVSYHGLRHTAAILSVTEALERRAERNQEWPFDEATFARVVAIASFVTAGTLARLILAPFGI